MKPSLALSFLRPYLCQEIVAARRTAYLGFYSRSRRHWKRQQDILRPKGIHGLAYELSPKEAKRVIEVLEAEELHVHKRVPKEEETWKISDTAIDFDQVSDTEAVENTRQSIKDVSSYLRLDGPKVDRVAKLKENDALHYPRIVQVENTLTCEDFIRRYESSGSFDHDECVLRGRVLHIRKSGSKLVFLDIIQDGHQVQVSCNLGKMSISSGPEGAEEFRNRFSYLGRGDIISTTGKAILEQNGTLSLLASSLPTVLTPSIAPLPVKLDDTQTRMRNRHVDMLVHPSVSDTLRLRSQIIQSMRQYFLDSSFLEVQTPILASSAGGAIARPFTTSASEFSDKKLTMRIAPEIWLKRLVIGGLDRVFEIGPAFRNEGLDGTHNPEFTTCEFYKAYASLDELMSMTEELITRLVHLRSTWRSPSASIQDFDKTVYNTPYPRLSFIPTIESALGHPLPSLHGPNAFSDLFSLFSTHNLPLPPHPTLPTLLDKLSSLIIEPHCQRPTFITHHPSLFAPLSKQTFDERTGQYISLRAELFIQGREMANMYEEENDPFSQYSSFLSQLRHRGGEGSVEESEGKIDESYIRALEYGLPPTGGWGAGVDRIVMLLTGRERISDVLPFGSLRNVVGLRGGEG